MNSAVKETERKRLNELSGKVIGLCIEARKKMNHRGTKNTEIRRLASSADLAPASVCVRACFLCVLCVSVVKSL